jgi:hypothetical protein
VQVGAGVGQAPGASFGVPHVARFLRVARPYDSRI